MKKGLSIVATALMVFSVFSLSAMAAPEKNGKYEIPKAAAAPTIDGVKNNAEWNGALERKMTKDTVLDAAGKNTDFPGAAFYWMWDDDGMYFFAEVQDNSASNVMPADVAFLNSGDGIQFCFYTTPTSVAAAGDIFFFTVNAEGNFGMSDHFVLSDGSKGAAVTGSKVAVVKDGTNFNIEGFIPAEVLAKSKTPIKVTEGESIRFTNIVMAHDGTNQSLFVDCDSWANAATSNEYKLVAGSKNDENSATPSNPVTGSNSMVIPIAVLLTSGVILLTHKKKQH